MSGTSPSVASNLIEVKASNSVAEAAIDVVKRQQRAFADSDFDAALQFASKRFRSSVTLPQFKELIVSD